MISYWYIHSLILHWLSQVTGHKIVLSFRKKLPAPTDFFFVKRRDLQATPPHSPAITILSPISRKILIQHMIFPEVSALWCIGRTDPESHCNCLARQPNSWVRPILTPNWFILFLCCGLLGTNAPLFWWHLVFYVKNKSLFSITSDRKDVTLTTIWNNAAFTCKSRICHSKYTTGIPRFFIAIINGRIFESKLSSLYIFYLQIKKLHTLHNLQILMGKIVPLDREQFVPCYNGTNPKHLISLVNPLIKFVFKEIDVGISFLFIWPKTKIGYLEGRLYL